MDEILRIGRWQSKWTVERWNRRAKVWDVIDTFATIQEADAYLRQYDGEGVTK